MGANEKTANGKWVLMVEFMNYSQYTPMLFNGNSVWDFVRNVVLVYSAVTGEFIFWTILILIAFVPGYITSGSVLVPATTYLFVGGFLAVVAPPELSMPMYIILLISVSGIMYHFFVKR